jgi:DNA polymerase III epsilon subunit family exonuclease
MDDFKKTEFIIFDVETTGLSPAYGDRVIEVAAVKIRDLTIVDRFHSLIDPQRPLSYGAFLVNGISSEMLRGAPVAAEILPRFFSFLAGEAFAAAPPCLVGHNITFDLNFLLHEAALLRHPWQPQRHKVDTMRLARWLLPELGRYRLEGLARFLEIEAAQQHRAMADVEMTHRVLIKLLEMSFRRDVTDLSGLMAYSTSRRSAREGAPAANKSGRGLQSKLRKGLSASAEIP